MYAPCALGGTLSAETIPTAALPRRRGLRQQPARRARGLRAPPRGRDPLRARLRDQRRRRALRLGHGVARLGRGHRRVAARRQSATRSRRSTHAPRPRLRDACSRRGPRAEPVEPGEAMERVTGIGGVFFRSRDPEALVAWYAEHVGVPVQPDGYVVFTGERGAHVWAPFRAGHGLLAGGEARDGELHRRRPRRDTLAAPRRGRRGGREGRSAGRGRAIRLGGRPRGQPLRALGAAAASVRDERATRRSGCSSKR